MPGFPFPGRGSGWTASTAGSGSCKANSRMARHYDITVEADGKKRKARSITWNRTHRKGSMMSHPGFHALRTNILDRYAERLWRSHVTLTEMEAVFRPLKP